jgi:Tfp pilus assembly protein PilN
MQSMISIGASLLGMFAGRKTISAASVGRIGTAARAATRLQKERSDVAMAAETVESIQAQIEALSAQLQAEAAALPQYGEESFDTIQLKPQKTGIQVQLCALVWM